MPLHCYTLRKVCFYFVFFKNISGSKQNVHGGGGGEGGPPRGNLVSKRIAQQIRHGRYGHSHLYLCATPL
jgi:hypothetical protein